MHGDPQREIIVGEGALTLGGTLAVPPAARGLVLFAHGSGSSRFSPRNRFVAAMLYRAGLGTLLLDLLTEPEEEVDDATAELRFDINLLAARVLYASDWVAAQPSLMQLALGYFGSSTGAAAALVAAAERPDQVRAVVSRGGRPDLAAGALSRVQAPTLLLVGGADRQVLALNRRALAELHCERELRVIPDATHLFEEPGALERVAREAADWFARHLHPTETRAVP